MQREGCTFDDVVARVLQYSDWRQFRRRSIDAFERYKEVIDSLRHLCNNIEPGTNTRHSVATDYNKCKKYIVLIISTDLS